MIVTADDFGLAPQVNEAVEVAHRDGILTSASLMVSAPACEDAVARARRLPGLKVGLHLVLVEGHPTLPATSIPDLVNTAGRFRTDLVAFGIDICLHGRVRDQLAAEMTAQFARYAATGLALDHVDAHKHFHLHPIVTQLLWSIGAQFNMRALRTPVEPARVIREVDPAGTAGQIVSNSLARAMRKGARERRIATTDYVFGLAWSGALTTARLEGLLTALPRDSTCELYCHPASANDFAGAAHGYRYVAEYEAVRTAALREKAARLGVQLISYSDLADEPR